MTINTSGFVSFPFSHNGINFVAKVNPASRALNQILNLPEGVYVSMNKMALDEMIDFTLSLSEIQARVDFLNINGTELILELADNGI